MTTTRGARGWTWVEVVAGLVGALGALFLGIAGVHDGLQHPAGAWQWGRTLVYLAGAAVLLREGVRALRRLRSGADVSAPPVLVLPEGLAREVDALLDEDRFVPAVALLRERTGADLTPAVRAVRARRAVGVTADAHPGTGPDDDG